VPTRELGASERLVCAGCWQQTEFRYRRSTAMPTDEVPTYLLRWPWPVGLWKRIT